MPILVDLNQVAISNLMVSLGAYNKTFELNEDLIRHMILNSLRAYRVKFQEEYGELVICCDGRNYWRRDIFPFFKMGRKKTRANSHLDWSLIFETINKIRDDIKEHFPYKVIDVDRAEADDIIAVLTEACSPEPVLILSGDKDFMQLQKHPNVVQYAPVQKKFLKTKTPVSFLAEHIIRGDVGDGIPNCLSSDDVFMHDSKRQTPVTKKRLSSWLPVIESFHTESEIQDQMTDSEWRGFCRNRELIDFDYIPSDLKETILSIYYTAGNPGSRAKILNYLIEHRMKQLLDCIHEF